MKSKIDKKLVDIIHYIIEEKEETLIFIYRIYKEFSGDEEIVELLKRLSFYVVMADSIKDSRSYDEDFIESFFADFEEDLDKFMELVHGHN